jgi:hypothetical protein
MSTGIWTMLVTPSTQTNKHRTIMKYGCRNENVGIEKLHPYWDILPRSVRSALTLQAPTTIFHLHHYRVQYIPSPRLGAKHKLGCSPVREGAMVMGAAVNRATCRASLRLSDWNTNLVAEVRYAGVLPIAHPRTAVPGPKLCSSSFLILKSYSCVTQTGIAFSELSHVRRNGMNH